MDYKATESAVIADERRTMKYRTCSCDVASCDMSRVADVDLVVSGGSRKKYLGGLAPHHLGGNHG